MNKKPRKLTGKQKDFCKFYRDSTNKETCNNATKAYKKAYKCSYNAARANGAETLAKDSIKAEIARFDAETAEIMKITRAGQHKKLKHTYEVAERLDKPSVMVSTIREENEMCGFHREKALNPEKEAERAASMTDEERKLAEIRADIRIDEEARKHVKLLKEA